MRIGIIILGCFTANNEAAVNKKLTPDSPSALEMTFGEARPEDRFLGRKLRHPACVAVAGREIRGYVEYTISELKGLERTLDDDEMGDDDVFEAPADENMIFTKQAEIDNFHIKKAWQNRLPEFLKFCQKQIARSFPQVGVIRIRVREPNKDPVEKADFQRVSSDSSGRLIYEYVPTRLDRLPPA